MKKLCKIFKRTEEKGGNTESNMFSVLASSDCGFEEWEGCLRWARYCLVLRTSLLLSREKQEQYERVLGELGLARGGAEGRTMGSWRTRAFPPAGLAQRNHEDEREEKA